MNLYIVWNSMWISIFGSLIKFKLIWTFDISAELCPLWIPRQRPNSSNCLGKTKARPTSQSQWRYHEIYFPLLLDSSKSFASFIFAAKYGEPPEKEIEMKSTISNNLNADWPLSGWFNDIILLCASFTFNLLAEGLMPSTRPASLLFILGSKPPL